MKRSLLKIIIFLNRFSVDVSLSSVALAFFLSKLFGVDVDNIYYLLLFFSVNAIYHFDHFLDCRRQKNLEHFSRLYFIFFLLSSLWAFVGITYTFFAFSLASPQGQYFFLAGEIIAVFLYFLVVHSRPSWLKYSKELMISVLFAGGCFMPIFLSNPTQAQEIIHNYPIVCLNFILLLFHNVCLFSFFHLEKDVMAGQPNIFANMPLLTAMKSFTTLGLMTLLSILFFSPPANARFYRNYMLFALIIQNILFRAFIRNEEKCKNLQQKEVFLYKISFIANGYFAVLSLLFSSVN